MNIQDPMMLGYDPGENGIKSTDFITSAYESRVCEQFIESTWAPEKATDSSNVTGPTGLNQKNATAAEKIYSPLSPGVMRLLRLHGGSGKIQCSILVLNDQIPSYQALSYVWGSTRDPQTITLDRFDFLITRNLFEVLLRLRKENQDRLLWIDALVINQLDFVERSKEVTKMLDRYSGASETIVWLGNPLEGASYGRLDIISAMKFLSQPDLELPKNHEGQEWVLIKQAVEAIFCSIYWTRSWTVQEIMYSEHATLHYGSMTLAMDDFLRFVDVNSHVAEVPIFRSIVIGDRRVALRPGYGQQKRYLRIPSWLGCYLRNRDCTNPRDCVFAYYGCFPPEARRHIEPDYERSPLNMALDVTKAWIASEKNLDFLLEIGCRESCWRRPEIPSVQCIPSWLPSYFGKQTNCSGRVVAGPDVPQARPPLSKPIVRFDNKNNAMYVKGVLLGTIEDVGTPHYKPVLNFKPFESFLLHHLRRVKGNIGILDRGLKEAIQIHFPTPELKEAAAQYPEITHDLEAQLDWERKSLNESNEAQLRVAEGLCSIRIAFSYKPWPASRPIQISKVDVPFGLGTEGLKPGDQVFAVVGCSTPLVLRPIGDFHIVVGNSKMFLFVNGILLQEHLSMLQPRIFVDITLR
ncbi:HET-domain-containing protein [Amniculicola lignicola CBS 123094]|uniref:HET-domain-containing protein n=1 Tax=Amniculicola lignicola CBS 123094 TaxID=1392246 RepID=A0A6A5WX94_9PLEO|nr:HET-domain-containing protein [Amniculicola lignicola CBS 123094]